MKKLLLATLIGSALVGCNGGGGGGDDSGNTTDPVVETKVLTGTVIGGSDYVSGATVFVDSNFNGKLDAGEAKSTTDTSGKYSLTAPDTACTQASPIVALVGGADPYVLVSPPSAFVASSSSDNTTPLTTNIWSIVKREAALQGKELSCATLTGVDALNGTWLTETIADAEDEVIASIPDTGGVTPMSVSSYRASDNSLEASDLYEDYVESGDADLSQAAEEAEMVLIKETEMREANPEISTEARLLSNAEMVAYGLSEEPGYQFVSVPSITNNTGEESGTIASKVIMDNVYKVDDTYDYDPNYPTYQLVKTIVDTSKWSYYDYTRYNLQNYTCQEVGFIEDVNGTDHIKTVRNSTNTNANDVFTVCANANGGEVTQDLQFAIDETIQAFDGKTFNQAFFNAQQSGLDILNVDTAPGFHATMDSMLAKLKTTFGSEANFGEDFTGAETWQKRFEYVYENWFQYEGSDYRDYRIAKINRTSEGTWYKEDNLKDEFQIPTFYCLEPAAFILDTSYDPETNTNDVRYSDGSNYYEWYSNLSAVDMFGTDQELSSPVNYWYKVSDQDATPVWIAVEGNDIDNNTCRVQYPAWEHRGEYDKSFTKN